MFDTLTHRPRTVCSNPQPLQKGGGTIRVAIPGCNYPTALLTDLKTIINKDKGTIMQKSGVKYRYKCDRVECDKECIRDSTRTSE